MNILFITENVHPFSGSSVQLNSLASALRSEGHICLILYSTARADLQSRGLADLSNGSWVAARPFKDDPNIIRDICTLYKIDLIHCHIEIFRNVAESVSPDTIPIVINYGSSASPSRAIQRAINDKNPQAIVSVSEGGAALLRSELPKFLGRILTIRQSTEVICSSAEEERVRPILASGPYVILLASYRTYKGIPYFCQAMENVVRKHPGIRGIVVGRVHHIQLKRLSESLGLVPIRRPEGTQVGFCVFVGPTHYPGSWLKVASVCVCSSTEYEGVPGALREAMLAGVPIVSTDVGYARELVKDRWNGSVVPAANADALAEAINRKLENSTETLVQVLRAKKYIQNFFSIRRRLREHLNLYDQLIAARPRLEGRAGNGN